MIIKGDKIKLVQKLGNFDKVGDTFTVASVENGVISFNCSYGTGCMTYDEFEKYFEKVEEPTVKIQRKWSEWKLRSICYQHPFLNVPCAMNVKMRENGKKVQLRYMDLRAEASCHKDDKFDVSKGFNLAKKRLVIKLLENEISENAKLL